MVLSSFAAVLICCCAPLLPCSEHCTPGCRIIDLHLSNMRCDAGRYPFIVQLQQQVLKSDGDVTNRRRRCQRCECGKHPTKCSKLSCDQVLSLAKLWSKNVYNIYIHWCLTNPNRMHRKARRLDSLLTLNIQLHIVGSHALYICVSQQVVWIEWLHALT